MPHNILFASWYVGLGGGETDLLTLAHDLNPDAYRPHLLLPRMGTLGERWQAAGWPVHTLPYRGASTWFIPALWARFPVVKRMAALLQAQQIDLVHSNYHTLPLIAPAARRAGVPVVWTCHGWWFRPKPWQRAFFRRIPGVARSQAIRDGFLGDPPFMPPEQLPVVYSGIDTERFHPDIDAQSQSLRAEIGIGADAPLVSMIARFQSVKGHETFQAMARHVLQTLPEARFVVAGEDVFGVAADQAYKQRVLQTHQQDSLLRERLHYIGFRDDVERLMAASDVVVCASDFESYGKANLEAMACGTPVVSTNRGGPAETVRDGETGYLAPPRDPQALAERVLALLQDEDQRQQMGQAARQHVVANFSAQTTTAAYLRLFKRTS